MASVVPAARGPGAACSLDREGTTQSQKRSQDQSTLGRIAGAVTGALRDVVQDVSDDGCSELRHRSWAARAGKRSSGPPQSALLWTFPVTARAPRGHRSTRRGHA